MDIRVGDILTLKKPHPCGGRDWLTLRVGADFKLRCVTCNREIMSPRANIERGVKKITRPEDG